MACTAACADIFHAYAQCINILWLGIRSSGCGGAEMVNIGLKASSVFPDFRRGSGIAWSENLTPERAAQAGVTWVSKQQLFEQADILTVHLVLSERSRGLVDAQALGWMKPGARLVNTARGPIVDEQALVHALESGRLAGAALDVFADEPLPLDHPFRHLPNVLATPHVGYVSEQNYRQFYGQMIEDIQAWASDAPIRVLG